MGLNPHRAYVRAPIAITFAACLTTLLAEGMAQQDRAGSEDRFATEVRPLIERFCGECHAADDPASELELLRFQDGSSAAGDPTVWELVGERLRAGEMPPSKAPQPSAEERRTITAWISSNVEAAPSAADHPPGRTVLRRLNRFEIENAVLDVLGVRIRSEDYLPLDEAAGGFDTIGSALSFSDAHLEGLLSLAEDVSRRAVPWTDPALGSERRIPPSEFRVDERFQRGEQLGFFTEGGATTELLIERSGDYEVTVRARASQAGDEPARMRVSVGPQHADVFNVENDDGGFESFRTSVRLDAGTHTLAVAFVNDYFEPDNPDPKRRDRNLYVARASLRGPLNAPPEEATGLAGAAQRDLAGTLSALAEALWRRPLEPGDLERMLALSPPEEHAPLALRTALVAVLASPRFLFRLERDPLGAAQRELDGYELATRLASFLWSSVPDERLRARAADGSLVQPDVLAAEARRLVADARSSRMVEGFAFQWLQLRPLQEHAPDPKRFPAYDADLRAAMQAETELLFEAVLREGRPVSDLIDPGFTFLNERLAAHYGIDGVQGPLMRRVPLRSGQRGGLLAHASVLTATSYPTRTSPVLRGKWVLEVLLGDAPPPPPADVPGLPEKSVSSGPRSMRAALEAHRANAACAACHDAMDPLGFGLESYDAIGKWRDQDRGKPLDTGGTLPDGRTFDGPVAMKRILAEDRRLQRNVTERLMVYALGRALSPADDAEVEAIASALGPGRDSLGTIVEGIVRSKAFRTLQTGTVAGETR